VAKFILRLRPGLSRSAFNLGGVTFTDPTVKLEDTHLGGRGEHVPTLAPVEVADPAALRDLIGRTSLSFDAKSGRLRKWEARAGEGNAGRFLEMEPVEETT